MFGYISINKQELKFKEFDRYRAYYCGFCRDLRTRYKWLGQLSLSYDMTFLIILLTALYEPESLKGETRCIAHPLEKHPTLINRFTEYASDMNMLLTYEKCRDDWKDEKKFNRLVYSGLIKSRAEKVREKYPKKVEIIYKGLKDIEEFEKKGEPNIDLPAGAFGNIMAGIFAWAEDEWEKPLSRIGMYLGKTIYIMDAFEDMEKDKKTGNYNPLLLREDGNLVVKSVEPMLTMMLGLACRDFERLPIVSEDLQILKNILYSGIWSRYLMIRGKEENESI